MSELVVREVPTTIVTGALGTGKTTAILDFFRHHPGGETWAVLVNEFGDVDIDGAILGAGGMAVKEIPGGCICCSAGLALKVNLVRILREIQPDRLFIEPSGLARPASIVDLLRSPGIAPAISLRAVIGLVDARHLGWDRYRDDETWLDQVRLADVLVANHTDRATEAQLTRFVAWARDLYPPKIAVATTEQARMDPEWLSMTPSPRIDAPPGPVQLSDLRPPDAVSLTVPAPPIHEATDHPHRGWIWPARAVFDRDRLESLLQDLVRPGPLLPQGAVRLKGIFRTPRLWLLVNATPDTIAYEGINYRRDSRIEIIAAPGPEPDWDAVDTALTAAMLRTP